MEMISPEQFFDKNILNREKKEIKKELCLLVDNIRRVEAAKQAPEAVAGNNLDTILLLNKEYLKYSFSRLVTEELAEKKRRKAFEIEKYLKKYKLDDKVTDEEKIALEKAILQLA